MVLLSPAGSTEITKEEYERKLEDSPFTRRAFYCIASKVYGMEIRPSRMMNNCFFGERFMNRVLEGRLKLGEEEKAAWKAYLKKVVKLEGGSETGFYKLFKWPLTPERSI